MSKIIDFARQQIGKPYVFATSGTDSFDCSGLTLRAAKQIGLNLYHGASTQWARGSQAGNKTMFGYWEETGTIESLPDKVAFLFNQDKTQIDKIVMSHTGLYDGRGRVIQAGGPHRWVSDELINRKRWSHWAVLKKEWMDKDMSESDVFQLRKGDRGDSVKKLQSQLISIGYKFPKFGADGDFGGETEAAVKAFQADNSLPVDGSWDKECQERLEERFSEPIDDKLILDELDGMANRMKVLIKALRRES